MNEIKGSIIKRVIRGKERFYHQWREDGVTKSRYLRPSEILPLRAMLERGKTKQPPCAPTPNQANTILTPFLTGNRLDELAASVSRLRPRKLLESLLTSTAPIVLLSGARASGKTILLHQAIAALDHTIRDQTAYLSLPINYSAAQLPTELMQLYDLGLRRFYLDGLERSSELTNLLPALIDTFGSLDCRFICATRNVSDDFLSLLPPHVSIIHSSPLSFADFSLLFNPSDPLREYLDYLGLSDEVKSLTPPPSAHVGAAARKALQDKLTRKLAEHRLKDILLREIRDRRAARSVEVFTLELSHGGMDIVVADHEELTCELYEVSYSSERTLEQLSRLNNSRNLDQIEHRYGTIIAREVLYLGRDAWHASGVFYRNTAKFLA